MVFAPPCHPPFLRMGDNRACQLFYETTYCQGPVTDYFGLPIRFRKDRFDHVRSESSQRDGNKDVLSADRAERLGWILETLESHFAVHYVGWDRKKKRYDAGTRVSCVFGDYVVVVRIVRKNGAAVGGEFRTAFVADQSIAKIRTSPLWVP